MGSSFATSVLWFALVSFFWTADSSPEMQGVFQNLGNKKTQRFPVYKAVKGFDVFLRFSASKCTGQLVEITSRDNKEFLRITLLEVGPIRFSFNTYRGRGQLEFGMPKKGSFCDGKRHVLALNIYRGVVFYYVDRSSPARFYVSRLAAPFSSPDKIVLGRGLEGCVSGATVINRFSKTGEHRIMSSGECALRETTLRPTTVPTTSRPDLTSIVMARKVAASQHSPNPKCEPLPFDACKGLGYSHTQFPNILKHKTTNKAETELKTLLSKLQPKCSLNLIPFLCHLFFPPCPLPQIPTPPCRSLCKSVVEDCSLLGVKDTWSRYVSCEHFPRVDDKKQCFSGDKKVAARRTTVIEGSTEKKNNLTETTSLLASKRLQGKHARFPKPVLPMTASVNKIKTKGKGIEQTPSKEVQGTLTKSASPSKTVPPSTISAETRMSDHLTNATQSPEKAQSYSQKAASVTKPVLSSKVSTVTTINTTQSLQKAQSYSQKVASVTKPVLSSKLSAVTTINTTQFPQKAESYSQKAASITKPVLSSKVSAVTSIDDATSLPNLAKEYSTKHVPLSESVQHTTASTDTTINEQQRNVSSHNHGSTSKPLEPSTIQINSTRTTGQPRTEIVNENVNTTGFRPENMTTYSRSLFEAGRCGKLLGSSEGQFTSPGYPGEYPPSTTCKWLISLSQEYQEIIFTFHSVFLEEDRNCVYDYIAVYDVLENQVGERYCGSITRPINKHVRGNVAVVIFRSDSTNSKKGFSLSYKASKSRIPPEINT
ncbi:uncharacterized protein [Acropora muricata]|uniref:uncharacterized protein isoform X2 n=1 Tax=Acropora muricata TaxID=159855 RepID=UPI0034E601C7